MNLKPTPACFLLLVSAWPFVAFDQGKPSPSQSPGSTEVQVLEAQVEIMRNYQEQFVSVITWSLGAVLTMAFGLAAYNWYSTKVSYERDIQALRQEKKALHAELSSLLKSETEQAATRLLGELATKQAEIQSSLAKVFDSKLSEIRTEVLDLQYKLRT